MLISSLDTEIIQTLIFLVAVELFLFNDLLFLLVLLLLVSIGFIFGSLVKSLFL